MREGALRKAMVREEFYRLTEDFFLALVLNQFNFYQLATKNVLGFIEQENARSKVQDIDDGYIQPIEGWFYKSAEQLCQELMHPFKRTKAQELMQKLVDRGWVMVRNNPTMKWDRVKQYRLDLNLLHWDLMELGFTLPNWDTLKFEKRRQCSPPDENALPPSGIQTPVDGAVITARRCTIPEVTQREHSEESRDPKSFPGERTFPNSLSPGKGDSGLLPNTLTRVEDSADAEEEPDIKLDSMLDRSREFFQPADSTSLHPGAVALPDPQGSDFPKRGGGHYPDWCEGIRLYDYKAAEMLATIFPDEGSPLTHEGGARKLYRRRQDGLTGLQVELLTRYYRKARFEGTVRPKWKVRTLVELLASANLPDALHHSREAALEDVEELEFWLDWENDEESVARYLYAARKQVKDYPDSLMYMVSQRSNDLSVLLLAAKMAGKEVDQAREENLEAVMESACKFRPMIEYIKRAGFTSEEIYGI